MFFSGNIGMMKKKELIKELRAFYERQLSVVPDDDSSLIKEILSEPNPAVGKAMKLGLTITVAKGDTIYEIAPDGTRTRIGSISRKDVPVSHRRYSFR
jgi:LysM repeat protein